MYCLHKMKNQFVCVLCVFILNLRWFSLVADNAALPGVSAPENVSAGSDSEILDTVDGGDTVVRELEPSVETVNDKVEGNENFFEKQLFAEATSQNAGLSNDLTTGGQQVVVTLSDVATPELQKRAVSPSQNENTQALNTTVPTPEQELNQSSSEPNLTQQTDHVLNLKENLTEEIPSFSEWTQKRLEEVEKNKEPPNTTAPHQNGGKGKLRWKNYASLNCGSKVIASNPEAVSSGAILSPSRDECKLNACTNRIWFVVELCEAIQVKKIDLANFELYSSSPKDFAVSVSDRFPSREWSNVGQFTAKDERDIQSFDLYPHLFARYIKVELKSHYGSEHYCPISLFRVYGTTEFEVLEKEEAVQAGHVEDDDDDDDESLDIENGDSSKNLFSSATDAVISIVKKAAQVLGNKGNNSDQSTTVSQANAKVEGSVDFCISPSHLLVCDNCTDVLYEEVHKLLSCHMKDVRKLVQISIIRNSLVTSNICRKFGLEFCKSPTIDSRSKYVEVFFPDRYLGAMCNVVAAALNKVVLNVSTNYQNETRSETDDDKLVNIETSEPHVIPTLTQQGPVSSSTPILDNSSMEKSTCSTDVSYASQIKPTRTLNANVDLSESVMDGKDEMQPIVTSTESPQSVSRAEEAKDIPAAEQPQTVEPETATETMEGLDDNLDQFIDFNGEGQHLPSAQTTQSTPQAQKESVFLRQANRIKALERNMSLSGQYLEELSKRYKKQVEEIQKLLDKTIQGMAEESKKNKELEERLAALTAAIELEKKSWSSTIYCVIFSSLVPFFIITFCYKIPDTPPPHPQPQMKRRKSIDVVRHPVPPKKKRRPSDQAMKIVRSSLETSEAQARRKKRKKQALKRSNSISTLSEERHLEDWKRQESSSAQASVDWVEGQQQHIEDIPFALDESEHTVLEPMVIGAPNYLKTALNARAVRANGDVKRKSVSLDETGRATVNGFKMADSPKKERKGLRKIFKKVF